MPAIDGRVRLPDPAGRWTLLTTSAGSGLVLLEATVVNVALPALERSFATSLAGLRWTINAFTLTISALILLGGGLGDRFGRRRMYLLGIVWFAAASMLCGLAPSLEWLIAGRALPGISVSVANLASFFVYRALAALMFVLPIQLQVTGGYTALATGLALLPLTALTLALSARGGTLAARLGPRDRQRREQRGGQGGGSPRRRAALLVQLPQDAASDPVALNHGFDRSMLVGSGLFVLGGLVAWFCVPRSATTATSSMHRNYCATNPQLEPPQRSEDARAPGPARFFALRLFSASSHSPGANRAPGTMATSLTTRRRM